MGAGGTMGDIGKKISEEWNAFGNSFATRGSTIYMVFYRVPRKIFAHRKAIRNHGLQFARFLL